MNLTTEAKEKIMDKTDIEVKFNDYLSLLDCSYNKAVNMMLLKYGEVKDDYYREISYKRFLSGEIKSIAKGKYIRAIEGLECHHIFENQCINLSNKESIYINKYPYQFQEKKNLIYCDIIEHFILHVLIIKETNGEYGEGGNEIYLRPKINDWFISKKVPKPTWMQACIKRAYLPKDKAQQLLTKADEVLKEYKEMKKKEHVFDIEKYDADYYGITVEELRKRKQDEILAQKEEKRKIELQNITQLDRKYPNLKSIGIDYTSSRKKIVKAIQQLDKNSRTLAFKEFYNLNNNKYKEELFDILNTLLE
jgi:hypothetical protein